MTPPDPTLALVTRAADPAAPPPALLPYQQRWCADASPLKVAEKSRRIGLTWGEAADDVLLAASASGSNVFYIGPTQDMAVEYIEACALWARAFDQAADAIEEGLFEDIDAQGNTKHILTYKIQFPGSGRRIVALSSRPANLRGKQGRIVIDEAAFHPDLAGLLKAAMAMLLWGDQVRVISTHDGADNAFNELIQEIRAGRRKGSVHRITFREAVAEGLYERVCLRRGVPWSESAQAKWVEDAYGYYADGADEELDVVPSQSTGAYLTMALIEARMAPTTPLVRGRWDTAFGHLPDVVREMEVRRWCEEELLPHLEALDPTRSHALGEDFGRIADLSCFDVVEEGADIVGRVKLHVELSNCPFRQQEQILFFIIDRLPRFRFAALDATGNGAALAEYAANRYGATRVEQVKLSEAFYLTHMPVFRAALQDNTFRDIPKDSQVRDDLRAIRLINGIPKLGAARTQKADGPKLQRHGDAAISLFLGHYALKRPVAPIEYTGVPSKGDRWEAGEDAGDYQMAGGW